MSITPEGEVNPYVVVYRHARTVWSFMLTDDEAYRDIHDRDDYLTGELQKAFPEVHVADIQWLGNQALESVIDQFQLR